MHKTTLFLSAILISCSLTGQKFIDKSEALGFDVPGVNRGVSVADYNCDGYEDIYISRKDGANLLYRNLGNFQFEEVSEELGLDFSGASLTGLWIDIDNDGDQDLFLANSLTPCKLYLNQEGVFSDVSLAYLPTTQGNLQSANAVDFDNDGDVDIYLARFLEDNVLLRNEGGEYFIDYSSVSGIADSGQSMGAVFFDYDNDGDQDLYQTRDANVGNLFYRNEGGYFIDVTEETGTGYKGQGMGVDVADVDGDGLDDLYFSNLYENVLYIQNEDHSFRQYNNPTLQDEGMGWGTLFFDSNNDSKKDVFLANDSHFVVNATNHPNKLVLNRGGMQFFAPSMNPDFQNTHASYGAASGDFDNDGKLDLVVANAGTDGNQIFQNQSIDRNYLSLNLTGTQSNRFAIGAKVVMHIQENIFSDNITLGHSYGSQSSSRIHFGLDDKDVVDSLVIYWPSGERQVLREIEPNQLLNITEPIESSGNGELVWTDPIFPTQTDDITLYFDAKEGNAGLAGFTGEVFMHAGLITNNSSSPTDWKYVQGTWGVAQAKVKMTPEGDDVYSSSYNITDFYGIPPGEVVKQLAFVFRNADGSRAGRSEDGSDIYHDIFPPDAGLLVDLVSPQNDNTILIEGEILDVVMSINKEAQVSILDNGVEIYSGLITELNLPVTASGLGTHDLVITVDDGSELIEITRKYFVLDSDEVTVDAPAGTVNGVNYNSSSYVFQLTAPDKQNVFLLCPDNNYTVDINYKMNRSRDGQTFWIELPKVLFLGDGNTYQYLVDGNITIADPFSTVVLDPSNDAGVPSDVKDALPSYPTGMTTGIVTAFDQEQQSFPWTDDNYERPANPELVIYEIMMRDFLQDKNYKSLLDTLDYLKNLGINAIELMPISEFEGNQSWGYNPSFHMAADKFYGTRDQLKAVINACHEKDIAVILDVVFNHAFSQSPLCQLYWNPAEFRPSADSPYLNETAKHPYNVGYDFNHESPYTKEWVKQVLSYWIEEFHFDGFRFDLSKGLTQTFSGNNGSAMSQYDQSRINILKEYSDHIWGHDDSAYVIMEHFADNSEEKVLADYGMMLWGNVTHQFGEAAMGYRSDLDWADYTSRDWSKPNLIAYMESHDEERMGYKLKNFGDATGDYDTKDLAVGMDRIAAASAIYFSIPGPKMLWQFGELGYDESINRCTNGSVNNNCRLDPKPIRWNYFEDEHRANLYDKLSAMLHLRNNYPVFTTDDFSFSDGNLYLKLVYLHSDELEVVTMANFRTINSDINPKFPFAGTWHEYFSGDEIDVADVEKRLTFGPGEYRIYLSEKITPPGGFFTTSEEVHNTPVSISPNPCRSGEMLTIEVLATENFSEINLCNSQGERVKVETTKYGEMYKLTVPEVPSGVYFLKLGKDKSVQSHKLAILN